MTANYLIPYISNHSSDHLSPDISAATSMTIEDICSILNQQGMIQNRRDSTPYSPSMRPSPGQSIRFVRGRKTGSARKLLQRKQTDDDSSRGPFVPPREYEIVWDPEAVNAYLDKWTAKGYLTLKPEKLKWSPFILQRTTKPATNAPLTTVDHGTEVKIVDLTVKKEEDRNSRSLEVEDRLRTPSVSTRDDESSVDLSLHAQGEAISPSTSRLKAQIEKDHKLALKLANIPTPSTRRTRLRSRDGSTPQVYHNSPTPDTPRTRSRITNGSNGIPGTPNARSPSVMSTVSRLRHREKRSRSGSAARSTITRSRSAMKTPSIVDDEDDEEDDNRDAEGDIGSDGDYVDVEADVDEDEKFPMMFAEEEAKSVPMKRLRSRSGTASNHQDPDLALPAHVDEDVLTTPGIKRSDSNWSLTRKRMRIDSSPAMEESLALPPEEIKHMLPPPTLVAPAVTPEQDIAVNGSGINGTHSDYPLIKADSPPMFKMERIPEAELDIAASLTALKNGGRFSDAPILIKDPPIAFPLVTSLSSDADSTNPNQTSNSVPVIEATDYHGFSGNPSDSLGPRIGNEDEYSDIDAEGELDDEEGIDIEAVL